MNDRKAEHLGDGAYVCHGNYAGEVIIMANSHDMMRASDIVHLDPGAVVALLNWLRRNSNGQFNFTLAE